MQQGLHCSLLPTDGWGWLARSGTVILSLVIELFCVNCVSVELRSVLQAVLKPSYMIRIKAVGTVIPSTFFDALEEFIKHDHLLLRRIWWQKSTHRAKYCIWLLGEMHNSASTPMAGGPVETITWLPLGSKFILSYFLLLDAGSRSLKPPSCSVSRL